MPSVRRNSYASPVQPPLSPHGAAAGRFSGKVRGRPGNPLSGPILLFFVLLFAEGVLRKWLLPALQQPLIFIREPVLLYIYYLYLRSGGSRVRPWLAVWMAAGVLFVAYGLLQLAATGMPPLVMLVGLRNYILYVPLAFIIAERADRQTVRSFVLISLVISIPIAMLVAVQFKLPPSSFLNKGTSEGAKGVILVAENIVRPYGPFTYAQAQNTFAVMMVAVSMIAWEHRRELRLSALLIGAGTVSALVMGALSGGRTFFGGAILVVLTYLVSALSAPSAALTMRRVGLALGGVAAFAFVFVVVFPSSFAAMSARQERATRREGSTAVRGLSMMTLATDAISTAPTVGHGMGLGSNIGAALANGGAVSQEWNLSEYDWPRIVQELGPAAGLTYLSFRVYMFLLLGVSAFLANRRFGNNSAMIFFGFSGYLVLVAQVVGQSQILSFCWFSAGVTLALSRNAGGGQNPRKDLPSWRADSLRSKLYAKRLGLAQSNRTATARHVWSVDSAAAIHEEPR